MLSVSEIFTSFQGEGRLTGVPSIFIRLAGCHLRCGFCDTRYAQCYSNGLPMSVENILQKVIASAQKPTFPEFSTRWKNRTQKTKIPEPEKSARILHIVITGGEPLLFPSVAPLVRVLHEHAFHVTIETSGTRFLATGCDLLSVSPKMENSGNLLSQRSVSRTLRPLLEDAIDYQMKFVINKQTDCTETILFLNEFPFLSREKVLWMPQGQTEEEVAQRETWVRQTAAENGFGFSPRAHLFWFGSRRGV